MGIQLLQGREFGEEDRADSERVAIISETMAHRLWPGEDPVGKRIKPGPPDSPVLWRTIIGVVKDVRQFELNADPRLQMYYCYVQPARRLAYTLSCISNAFGMAGSALSISLSGFQDGTSIAPSSAARAKLMVLRRLL